MIKATTSPKQEIEEPSILIPIDISELPATNNVKPNLTYANPTSNIEFSHDYITDDLNKYQVDVSPCNNCCPAVKHFSDSKAAIDKIICDQIVFIKNDESILSDPSPGPGLPIFDPSRIGQELETNRPRGTVATQRFQSKVEGKTEYKHKAIAATLKLIDSLKDKPQSVNEIQFKI